MDFTPHTGISFSAGDASALNSSLALHKVHFDSSHVGDYELLNLTWFEPPAPSPGKLCFFMGANVVFICSGSWPLHIAFLDCLQPFALCVFPSITCIVTKEK